MPQGVHCFIVGLALDAAVPGAIVVGSITIGLAVGAVVFDVVGHQIAQREPVMCGDEVHARRSCPAALLKMSGDSEQPLRQLTDLVVLRRQKSRMWLRKRSFHSLQPDPKAPTW